MASSDFGMGMWHIETGEFVWGGGLARVDTFSGDGRYLLSA